jgi:hypothetical protein
MACSGRLATADDLRSSPFACLDTPLDPGEAVAQTAMLEMALDMASADVYAAMAASGMCDCTLASWATEYIKKLAIIDAVLLQNCPCVRPKSISDEMRQAWLTWLTQQLELIRMGKIELCAGATGSEFPALGWAEQTVTIANTVKIISNRINRLGS